MRRFTCHAFWLHSNHREMCYIHLFSYIKHGVRDVSVGVILMSTSLNILRNAKSLQGT